MTKKKEKEKFSGNQNERGNRLNPPTKRQGLRFNLALVWREEPFVDNGVKEEIRNERSSYYHPLATPGHPYPTKVNEKPRR